MSSTFLGLNIATRGLSVSKASLAVTTNNISNSNTKGYSRQTVNQAASGPAAKYSTNSYIGVGSQINSIDQERDPRIDQKYWRENGIVGEWETKSTTLKEMENVLNESSGNGLTKILSNFYDALSSVSGDAGSSTNRVTLQQAGKSICEYLNNSAEKLTNLRESINGDIKSTVDTINAYGQQVADLNRQITTALTRGEDTNDLKDQRALLIDKLSKVAKIEVNEINTTTQSDGSTTGTIAISVDGNSFVTGSSARQLECYVITGDSMKEGLSGIRWQDTKEEFSTSSGELKAYLELRDGDGSEYKGVPYYTAQLNDFAQTFAKAFNEGIYKDGTASSYKGHADGYTLDGLTDVRFFSYDGKSSSELIQDGIDSSNRDAVYKKITAANISLSEDVTKDTNKIAAASSTGGDSNNEVIKGLINLCKDTAMFAKGTPDEFVTSMVSTLGSDSSYATRLNTNYTNILNNITDRRKSVSGVDSNEETANWTKYQEAYSASAKIFSTWNEIYKETIDLLD